MIHHGVNAKRERVLSIGLGMVFALNAFSLSAMGDENLSKSVEEAKKNESNEINFALHETLENTAHEAWIKAKNIMQKFGFGPRADENTDTNNSSVASTHNSVSAPQVSQAAVTLAAENIEQKIEAVRVIETQNSNQAAVAAASAPKIDTAEEPKNNNNQESTQNQESVNKDSWFSFSALGHNQQVLYGAGAIGVLAIGTFCYVLYKKGTLRKIGVSMKNHPWCAAAVTGVAGLSAAAGALYLAGADKEMVINFFDGVKTKLQNLPQLVKDGMPSLPTFGNQEKTA